MKRLILTLTIVFMCVSTQLFSAAFHESQQNMTQGTERHEFAFNLLKALAEGREENLLISPTSVHQALELILAGAEGETRLQLLRLLAPAGVSVEQLQADSRTTLDKLGQAKEGVILAVANALWIDERYPASRKFMKTVGSIYDAQARTIDFLAPGAHDVINRWVAEQTNGKIGAIIDRLEPDMRMVLTNATYLDALWQRPFDANDTRKRDFQAPDSVLRTPFMHSTTNLHVLETADAIGVLIPYADPRFSFFAIMGHDGIPISRWVVSQGPSLLKRIMETPSETGMTRVELALPKFTDRFESPLSNVLRLMGLELPFDPRRADFSGMSEMGARDLYVDEILHKTFIRVDEKGTEAAAVTAIIMRATSVAPSGKRIVFDRPFLYGIVDHETEETLFIGLMVYPEAP